MDLTDLKPGQLITSESIVVAVDDTRAYLKAVGDHGAIYEQSAIVPPMAVASFALGSIMERVKLPGGAIHSAQELEFLQPLSAEDTAHCVGEVVQNTVRGGMRFLAFLVSVTNSKGPILTGRTSIVIPENPVMQ